MTHFLTTLCVAMRHRCRLLGPIAAPAVRKQLQDCYVILQLVAVYYCILHWASPSSSERQDGSGRRGLGRVVGALKGNKGVQDNVHLRAITCSMVPSLEAFVLWRAWMHLPTNQVNMDVSNTLD